ncbi:MAG: response regulator transcription factor [Candidatus Obscuribacterales bacterium]|nr:response regulator transcription factor [Candidatus Obscuribacterales bacterium]
MAKILVVEDSADILEMVKLTLESEHYSVETAANGDDGWFYLSSYDYDLAILDWQMPGKAGIDMIREYRSLGGKTPILLLTGLTSFANKEEGLDGGADDYLTKPFNVRELCARVRALLRRSNRETDNKLRGGGIELDPVSYVVTMSGAPVDLQPKEFQLLEFFMRHPNKVFDQEAVLNRVWPSDSEATVQALRSTLRRLRTKIDPDGKVIKTVHGVGYIFRPN